MMNTLTPWRFAHWHFVVVLLLSACGGGGGGSDTPSGPPPSGSLDNQFGNGGIVKFNNTFTVGRDDAGHAIMLDGSGRILVTGYTTDDNLTRSMALWRYNANGTRDTTFGGDFNSDGIKDGFVTYNGAAGGF